MPRSALQHGCDEDPRRHTQYAANRCRDQTDEGSVGEDGEAKETIGGSDGGKHAQLSHPALRHDDECSRGDQRYEQQQQRRQNQRRGSCRRLLRLRS
jgi:hypothetical protein